MSSTTIYKEMLMDHYRNPRNYSDVSESKVSQRGSNPRCGDEILVGVDFNDEVLSKVVFQGRGCSVCMASASMMTESVTGLTKDQAIQLSKDLETWFDDKAEVISSPNDTLVALEAVRQYPVRRRCVLLSWQALESIVNEA